ncbi:hypothetical protein HanPI659440_Chr16g0644531 [Helianthus annuus]|nr:hypothetical protein HanPI659440_Chr16g0644531 [Helianthus annuus]
MIVIYCFSCDTYVDFSLPTYMICSTYEYQRQCDQHLWLQIPENAREVSVLMPGEDIPTFIAQPAPVPCPSERIPWSDDPCISYPKLTLNSTSQSTHHGMS